MFNISFVVVTVKARLAGLRPAPRGGGDGPRRQRAHDVLEGDVPADPARRSWPPRCSSFSLSIDDFVITNFVSGTTNTFPIWIYAVQPQRAARSRSTSSARSSSSAPSGSSAELAPVRAQPPASASLRGDPAMVDTVPRTGRLRRAPPRSCRGAAGVGPDHEPRRRPRRGLVARHAATASGTSTTPRASASPTPVTPTRGSSPRSRPRRRSCSTASRTSSTTSPGSGCTSASRGCSRAVRGRRSCRTRARRRSRPRSSWRASRPGRPAILAFRYGFHGRTAQAMALTAAKDVYRGAFEPLPGSVYHTAYPYCYRAAGGAARPVRLHLRLGGAARPAVPPARLPRQGRGRHRRAGHRRGRLHRAAARVPAAAARDHPPARDPAHRRRGPDRASGGPASCSRCATGTSSPTSWSWPRGSRRACRCPASSPGAS